MNWKNTLQKLEQQKLWDEAIGFMEQIVKDYPESVDVRICFQYLFLNILIEKNYNPSDTYHYYRNLARSYLDESYQQFYDNHEYLYLMGRIVNWEPRHFKLGDKEYGLMLDKARMLAPENLMYKESYYWDVSLKNYKDPELLEYARVVTSENSPVHEQLRDKGAFGEYLWDIKKRWCEGVLRNASEQRLFVNWKEILQALERQKRWDESIEFMQYVIRNNNDDKDAYMCMNYLLMNLLGEEDYDSGKRDYYWKLATWYFNESYPKYSEDPEFLYITGKTAVMGEWFFGIDQKDYEAMIQKAQKLDPENIIYNEDYYRELALKSPQDSKLMKYAQTILDENSSASKQLSSKGAVGNYILGMKRYWARDLLAGVYGLEK